MSSITDNDIYFIERNIHGAWVIYGRIGIRQYYDYTKSQARKLYLEEMHKRQKEITNEKITKEHIK